jgi:hypothetical protein
MALALIMECTPPLCTGPHTGPHSAHCHSATSARAQIPHRFISGALGQWQAGAVQRQCQPHQALRLPETRSASAQPSAISAALARGGNRKPPASLIGITGNWHSLPACEWQPDS